MSFSKAEIAAYYNSTQNHYKRWWKLNDHLGLHYGIWQKGVRTFNQSIVNTNKVLLELADINKNMYVLDAGCGVGGSSFYIHQQTGARVKGITLSEKQLELASENLIKSNLDKSISFELKDYNNSGFSGNSFDVIWACESMCHTPNKAIFLNECKRLLKPGGKIILCDYFLGNENQKDAKKWIDKWLSTWAISKIVSINTFERQIQQAGFKIYESFDFSNEIEPSAKRMFWASMLGAFPSILYNLTHPEVSKFASTHYKSGIYQYKALKAKLWQYHVVIITK